MLHIYLAIYLEAPHVWILHVEWTTSCCLPLVEVNQASLMLN